MGTVHDEHRLYLGKLGDVFGDSSRRRIYRHLHEIGAPVTASEVGEAFGLHRTVARAHLEKLTELGLVEAGTRRRSGGGRPAKTYALTGERLEVMLPPRRYERLARLLLRLVDERVEAAVAQDAALALGRAYGEEVAVGLAAGGAQLPVRLSVSALLDWLDAAGYDVCLDEDDHDVVAVEMHNCVYGELAGEHRHVVCSFDRGMLCGMLDVGLDRHCQPQALSAGDSCCRHEIRL